MSQFFIDTSTTYTDKFDMAKFMEFTDNFDPLTSKFLQDIGKLKPITSFIVQGEEYRPDLISRSLYQDPQYWWIDLVYNKVKNINEIIAGKGLRIASLNDKEDMIFTLKSQV